MSEEKRRVERDMRDAAGDTERAMEDAGDKVKAGMSAAKNKVEDPSRDAGAEYEKGKAKEKLK